MTPPSSSRCSSPSRAGVLALVFAGLPGWMLLGLAAVWSWPIRCGPAQGHLRLALDRRGCPRGAPRRGPRVRLGRARGRVGGARRRGMVGAVAGGFLGALLLTFAAPVPVVGTLLGSS